MENDHEWHTFDIEKDLEVRVEADVYYVREIGTHEVGTKLKKEEFDRLRAEGSS